jgi:hypothetical protein
MEMEMEIDFAVLCCISIASAVRIALVRSGL